MYIIHTQGVGHTDDEHTSVSVTCVTRGEGPEESVNVCPYNTGPEGKGVGKSVNTCPCDIDSRVGGWGKFYCVSM